MSRVQLILDTDMLTDCDDLAALSMLHTLADMGEAEILCMGVSSQMPESAAEVNAVNTYCGRPDIPVGAPKGGRGVYNPNSCFLTQISAEFPHALPDNAAAFDAAALYRKALAGAEDGSVTLLTIGYMTNLAALLASEPDDTSPLGGRELVRRKVRDWVCMGGNFPDDDASDNVNFTRDAQSAYEAIRNWPGHITFVGREIGHKIFVGNALKETDMANPVRRGYELHRGRYGENWDHHTADPSAVLYAVRGCGDCFALSENGCMNLQPDCSFHWVPQPDGRQNYILQKIDRSKMGEMMERLICAAPGSSKQ